MFRLIALLIVCEVSAFVYDKSYPAPPYVQSRKAFERAQSYLRENVPFEPQNKTDPNARSHLAFGILVEVTRVMVRDYLRKDDYVYNPVKIVHETTPSVLRNYNAVSNAMNLLLAEAQFKIEMVTVRMDCICETIISVPTCNYLIHQRIQKSNDFIKHRANLLLAIGDVSETLMKHKDELNYVVNSFTAVPYLLQHVETPAYQAFIVDLAHVLSLLRKDVPI